MKGALSCCAVAALLLGAAPAHACAELDREIAAHVEARRFEAAVALARARVEREPDSPDAHAQLATVWLRAAEIAELDVDRTELRAAPDFVASLALGHAADTRRTLPSRVRLDATRADEALAAFETLLARWPDARSAHHCVIEVHDALGREAAYRSALARAARRFRATGSRAGEELLRHPARRVNAGDLEGAARAYRTLLEVFPKSAPLLSSYGYTRVRTGALEEALEHFERARASAPRDEIVAGNLSLAALLAGDAERARAALERQAELRTDRAEPRRRLALLASATGRAEAVAWQAYFARVAAHGDGGNWSDYMRQLRGDLDAAGGHRKRRTSVLVGAAQAISRADPEVAVAMLSALEAAEPAEPTHPFLMAQAWERAELPTHAFAALQRAHAKRPGGSALWEIPSHSIEFEAGRVALRVQRYRDGVRFLERVHRGAPTKPALQYLLGLAYLGVGDRSRAAELFRLCLERDNNRDQRPHCREQLDALESGALPAAPAP